MGFEPGEVHVLGVELDVECLIGLKGRADALVRQVVGRSIGGCSFVCQARIGTHRSSSIINCCPASWTSSPKASKHPEVTKVS